MGGSQHAREETRFAEGKRQAQAEGEKHNVVSRETSHGCGAAMVMNIP